MNALLRKIKKRLRKSLVRVVPYNHSSKPNWFYRTIDEYIHSGVETNAKCIEVYPEYISDTHIPQEFLDKCTKYTELPKVATIPASRVVVIPQGRLYTESVENVSIITGDNKLLGEVSYQNKPSNLIEDNLLLKQQFFIPVKHFKGVVFHLLIGGSGSTNYFHWLFDSLARIHLLKKSGWFDKVDWFVVPSYKVNYQRESLDMLGIPRDKIIEGDVELHLQADLLLASTYVRYFEHVPLWCCNFLRDNFLKPVIAERLNTSPLVYISRRDANRRRIVNEDELIDLLSGYGFKCYELTSLSFLEKIELFRKAKVVVAVHGAGQANLVFCDHGTEVLEIVPDGFVFPIFYDICNKVGANYTYLISKADTAKTTINSNIVVDLEEVREKVKQMLSKHVSSREVVS
jgi:capsular polysaccharide biosynthesis protein